MSFIDDCLNGKACLDDIDDYVERWSDGEEGQNIELHEYLGMSWEEYSIWVTKPSSLIDVLQSRK